MKLAIVGTRNPGVTYQEWEKLLLDKINPYEIQMVISGGAKFDRFHLLSIVPLLRGGANYLRKSFVEGIIVATFDAQIIKDNIKL